ncbi:MAG: glutathione S-transferase N-terminal domain-containing protein [Actinomycetota bacterium]|nr:glutathione S-transferase N-terminal domain-containing protein [Actinomycetota bacterium]
MSPTPTLTLHVLPPSHPSRAAEEAIKFKGLDFEKVVLVPGEHVAAMEGIYGVGRTTVPGMVVDGEAVHGSRAILARLEEIAPNPPLFPEPIAAAVREAERWGDNELQQLGRNLGWGALHFRPESMGTMGGAAPLDPAGTDYAIAYVRASWKYHKITAVQLAADLAGLPAKLDHVDELAADGIIGGDAPTAADLQIGSTIRVFLILGDLRPLIAGRPCEKVAMRWFPDYPGDVPAGAFPAGWVPERG